VEFFHKNEYVRSYSIYKHDTTLKMTFGAFFFFWILMQDPLATAMATAMAMTMAMAMATATAMAMAMATATALATATA
jgi:hypothetical protein